MTVQNRKINKQTLIFECTQNPNMTFVKKKKKKKKIFSFQNNELHSLAFKKKCSQASQPVSVKCIYTTYTQKKTSKNHQNMYAF